MLRYARISNGLVVELINSERDIAGLYHQTLHWIDVTNSPAVTEGWAFDGAKFIKPEPAQITPPPITLASLQTQICSLAQRLEALACEFRAPQ
jgi:hypothetical protein